MTNLIDPLQATLLTTQVFTREFIAQPSQVAYDRMLSTATFHVRYELEQMHAVCFYDVVTSLMDNLSVFLIGSFEADLTGSVDNMLAILRYTRNPTAAALPLWNHDGKIDFATDLVTLAKYALIEDIRQGCR